MAELHDAIAVTLAVGQTYVEMAAAWQRALVQAGNAALAVTDRPEAFAGTGVETVTYAPEAAHIWHSKRRAIKAGLERARTVYFIDADHVLRNLQDYIPKLRRLAPGAGAYSGIPLLGKLHFPTLPEANTLLARAAAHMGVADWRALRWWGDWLYTVSRDEAGAWKGFVPAWDRFVAFAADQAPMHPLILGDGVAMAFAAVACGWTPRFETPALLEVVHALRHTGVGAWHRPEAAASA
jgi:hypothetical protein